MADNRSQSSGSNDISEMLRRLRESYENDKNSVDVAEAEALPTDDDIKASLERVFEEVSVGEISDDSDDEDMYFEDEDEDSNWFSLEEDDDGLSDDIEEILAGEIGDEPDEEAVEDVGEDLTEESVVYIEEIEESVEDEPSLEELDDDSPWYTDSESEQMVDESESEEIEEYDDQQTEEEPAEEAPEICEEYIKESVEDEPSLEELDDDSPWYTDSESEQMVDESESEEIEEYDDQQTEESLAEESYEKNEEYIEGSADETGEVSSDQADEEEWYSVDPAPEEISSEITEAEEQAEAEEISLDDESLWYDNNSENDLLDDEIYQDEEFEDDEDYEDFEPDPDLDEHGEIEDTPENDYSEQDVYIYDADKEGEADFLSEIAELGVQTEADEHTESEEASRIDATDISFLSTLGVSAPTEADEQAEVRSESSEDYAGDISYDYDGGEYVLEDQKLEISAGYKNEKRRTLVRLAASAAISILLFVYEMLSAGGIELPGMLSFREFPVSHILMSLQMLIVCALLSMKQLYVGLADLIGRRATPYSVSSAVVLANVIYSVIVAIVTPENYATYNFVGALAVTLAIGYEFLLLLSETHSFAVFASKKGQKYAFVVDCSCDETSAGGISLAAASTEFNKNYFFRTRKRPTDYGYLWISIFAVMGASVLVFAASLIFAGVGDALKNGILLVNMAMPVGVLGAFSFPIYRALVRALGNRGTMVGGAAVDEYSKTRFVTFCEEELFSSLKTTHLDLKPAGNENISDVLCKTSLLLASMGGPMRTMVESMQSDFVGKDVSVREVFDDGISAVADGSDMLAGSAQFLRQHGVDVDESVDFNDVDESNEVLYVSIDGRLAARYYLKYKADVEFIKLVNALGARGISVGIKTRNPAINSDIIARRCPELKYKVYTIKSQTAIGDADACQTVTDSGLVANGKASSLIYPLLVCCDLKKYYKVDMFIRFASTAVAAVMISVGAILGITNHINAVLVMAYQLFWFLPPILFGFFHFKHHSKRKKFRIVYR